jgi:uncharacterized repeat protein (TIGR04076 family)
MNAPAPPVTGADEACFELYDLRVEVVSPPGERILCGARVGDHFELRGEMLTLPPGQGISIYSLAAVLPLLAAKQRVTDPNDWMSTDAEVACPDPNCPTRLRIVRTGKRRFRHADTTVVPLPGLPR